jgi:hypothetical protein
MEDTMTSNDKPKFNGTEYMRRYRAEGKDSATKIQTRARAKAMAWVRTQHPDVWERCMAEAREQYTAEQEAKQ